MNIKNRFGLSLFISIMYIILIEGMYFFNITSFSFHTHLSFIENSLLKYLLILSSTTAFYYFISFVISPILIRTNSVKVFFIISGVIFVINNFLLRLNDLLPTDNLFQSEISLFFVIIFCDTTFFYSLNYHNLLK